MIISLVESEVVKMEKLVTFACVVGLIVAWYKFAVLWWACHVSIEELKEGDIHEHDN